jgi:hypothetical protein
MEELEIILNCFVEKIVDRGKRFDNRIINKNIIHIDKVTILY